MTKKIKPGDMVIMNDFDRPCSTLAAIVTSIKNNIVIARYTSAYYRHMADQMIGPISECTPVEDFGVSVSVGYDPETYHTTLTFKKTGESVARYRHGGPRRWQEELPATVKVVPSEVDHELD